MANPRPTSTFRTGLVRMGAVALMLVSATIMGACSLARGPLAPDSQEVPAVVTTPLEASAPNHAVGVLPWPTPLTQPGLVEIIELDSPPLPGRNPLDLALLGGRIYVANEGSGNLSIIADGTVQEVLPLPQGPYRLIADMQRDRVYVLCEGDAVVSVVAGSQLVDAWPIPDNPTAGIVVDEHLWIGTVSGSLVQVATETGQIAEVPPYDTEGMIVDLALWDDGKLVAATYQSLRIFDPATSQTGQRIPLDGYRTMVVTEQTAYVVAYDTGASAMELLSFALPSWEVQSTATIPDDSSSICVDVERERALVAGSISNKITMLDLVDGTIRVERVVGLSPQRIRYDADSDRIYVTNYESHTMATLEPLELEVVGITPLTLEITALARAPQFGSLYATTNTGALYSLFDSGGTEHYPAGTYPGTVRWVPQIQRVAVLDMAEEALLLLDREGQITHRVDTGPAPEGLYVDSLGQALYAGDQRFSWLDRTSETVTIPSGMDGSYPPLQVLRDTRRDRLYAVAWNGVPGSNGGYVARRWADGEWSETLPAPGRLSLVDVIYDPVMDRFYSTHAHMGQFGLQIAEGDTATEIAYIALGQYPQAMVLSPDTWHLWLILPSLEPVTGAERTVVQAYDTRTLHVVSQVRIDVIVRHAALDTQSNRLYLAERDAARVHVVQDVHLPLPAVAASPTATRSPTPPQPTPTAITPALTPSPTQQASVSPPRTPTATATPQPTPTTDCGLAVQQLLVDAWKAVGRDTLGCPLVAPPDLTVYGWQEFERGEMFWRSDTQHVIVALDDGRAQVHPDLWESSMPDLSCDADPPLGRWQPIRGFGLVWCTEPGLRSDIGWALDSEMPVQVAYQPFEHGLLFTHPDGGVFWLDRSVRWEIINP